MEKALIHYQMFTTVLAKTILIISALIVGLDVLCLFGEAVGRYVLGYSRAFMEELPRLSVPFVVFPMMGVLLKYKRHIAVEVLPERLSEKARAGLMLAVYLFVMAVAVQFLIAGIIAVQHYRELGFETHTEIVLEVWITYLPFPVGFGLLFVFAVEMFWEELIALIKATRGTS